MWSQGSGLCFLLHFRTILSGSYTVQQTHPPHPRALGQTHKGLPEAQNSANRRSASATKLLPLFPTGNPTRATWRGLESSGPRKGSLTQYPCPVDQRSRWWCQRGEENSQGKRKRQSQARPPPKHSLRTSRRHMLVFLQKEARENKQKSQRL